MSVWDDPSHGGTGPWHDMLLVFGVDLDLDRGALQHPAARDRDESTKDEPYHDQKGTRYDRTTTPAVRGTFRLGCSVQFERT